MRIDVLKYLIVGPSSKRDSFFAEAQKLGIAEFISPKQQLEEVPTEIQTFVQALHILRAMPTVDQTSSSVDYRSSNVLARLVVERNQEWEQLRERERVLKKEISRIQVFGHFSIQEIEEIEKETDLHFQFFFGKANLPSAMTQKDELFYIGTSYELNYYLSISKELKHFEGLTEMKIEKSLRDIETELAEIQGKMDDCEGELVSLAHHRKAIHRGLVNSLNFYHLEESKSRAEFFLEGDVFAVEAWLPANQMNVLTKLCQDLNLYCERILSEEKDRIPTYLENQGTAKLGEDLVGIYDTPSATDKDPSKWVFFSFLAFFSMIIADAGYGLLLLGISLYLYFKFGKKPGLGRRVILLSTYLSIGCVIWGIFVTSFFGIEFAPNSPVRNISFIHWMVEKKTEYVIHHHGEGYEETIKEFPQLKSVTDPQEFWLKGIKEEHGKTTYEVYNEYVDDILLELVLFIGTIHIILSFLRYLDRNLAGLGWILFMIGGYFFFPSLLKAVSLIHFVFGVPYEQGAVIGKYLLFGGIFLASILAIIQKRLGGLAEVMNVIQIFADVMSYLRIYALSLAGMVMASTFDSMGMSVPYYFGFFIILAGHAVNFVLALMGGLIHGLRLNFIEWYHYSFEGGGKIFNPLKIRNVE